MSRIVVFTPDLLFGSRMQGALAAAGHEVELVSELGAEIEADGLVVDLTSDAPRRIEQVRRMGVPTLGVYSHVEADVRAQAQEAGFALVVPRSRMAREAPALVARLLS